MFDRLADMTALGQLKTHVEGVLGAYEPSVRGPSEAVADLEELAEIERAVAAQRLLAAKRVEETNAWARHGGRSCADFVAGTVGQSVGRSAAELTAARRLEKLPEVTAAMVSGRLSLDQVKVICEAAVVAPAAESQLIEAADAGTYKYLVDTARRIRMAATSKKDRNAKIRAERCVRYGTDAEGAFTLHLRGPAADGVRIVERLKPFEEQIFRDARRAGERPTYENRVYDATVGVLTGTAADPADDLEDADDQVESASAAPVEHSGPGHDPVSGSPEHTDPGDGPTPASGLSPTTSVAPLAPAPPTQRPGPTTTGPPSSPPSGSPGTGDPPAPHRPGRAKPAHRKKPPGGDNTKVIIRCDHSAFTRGHTVDGETCEIAGVGPVAVETVKEILQTGDPFLTAVVVKGHDVLSVAHLGRSANAYQRTAIESISIGCTNSACNGTVGIQIDHRDPFAKVRQTLLTNLDPLCTPCHHLKTHRGWHLQDGTGRRPLLPPPPPPAGAGTCRTRAPPARHGPERPRPNTTSPDRQDRHRASRRRQDPAGSRRGPPNRPGRVGAHLEN
jgi:hypothetical protein